MMKNKNNIEPGVPEYLKKAYWWAYLHPKSVLVFERQWLVNLILFGNYKKLRNALIDEVDVFQGSRSLQIACAYGDFTTALLDRIGKDSQLDIVDVAQIQLNNLQRKLGFSTGKASLYKQDSTCLNFPENTFDNVILFFLLHEQPKEVREKTVKEAQRVCKPGGRIIYIDYHKPDKANPLRFFLNLVLKYLEPYALEFREVTIESIHDDGNFTVLTKKNYFGGFYQLLTMQKKT